MMRALVTGIDGFTGRYLVSPLVKAGFEVFGIARSSLQVAETSAIYPLDLNDFPTVDKVIRQIQPNVVVHLAAISFVAHDDVGEIYRTNILGSRNILESLARLQNPRIRVLMASSANVYGNAGGKLSEDLKLSPANDYAVTKLAMESVAGLYKDRLPITIVRPFNYTGVGQAEHFLIPKIVKHFQERAKVIELGNLDVARDFSDVRTVVDIYTRLITSQEAEGRTLNVCSGKAFKLIEIIDIAQSLTGHKIDVRVNPDFIRENEVKLLLGDRSQLESSIGNILDIPIEETLRWMLVN